MPSLSAAAMSIEALPMPVVIRSFSFGRRDSSAASKTVRSRIATTISKSTSLSASASGSIWSAKASTRTLPESVLQSAMASATF
jgi:hypothetical protein